MLAVDDNTPIGSSRLMEQGHPIFVVAVDIGVLLTDHSDHQLLLVDNHRHTPSVSKITLHFVVGDVSQDSGSL